jgi:hypothetical protein
MLIAEGYIITYYRCLPYEKSKKKPPGLKIRGLYIRGLFYRIRCHNKA